MRRLRCLLFKCTTNVYTSYGIDASTGRNVLLFPSYGTQWPRMLRTAKRRRCGPSERIDRKRCAICTANSSRRTNNGNITINYGKQQDRTRTIIIVRTQPLPIDCCNFFVVVFRFFFSHFVVARFCCWLSCIRFAAAVAAAVSTSDIALLLVRKHIQLSEQQRMRACMCAFDRANKRPSPVRALSHTHTRQQQQRKTILYFFQIKTYITQLINYWNYSERSVISVWRTLREQRQSGDGPTRPGAMAANGRAYKHVHKVRILL